MSACLRNVAQLPLEFTTPLYTELVAALLFHWNDIQQQQIHRLVLSMPWRLRVRLANQGGHTI